ncbi:radical SAM protein [bacterium]|nr:radical SAM protein [bacterium]
MKIPNILCSDRDGQIFDLPGYAMAGKSARTIMPIDPSQLIELPEGSQLYYLPGRKAAGYSRTNNKLTFVDDAFAVAAYIPPAYTHFLHAAYQMTDQATELPLFSFTAVGWMDDKFYVPAVRIDPQIKHQPVIFNAEEIRRKVHEKIAAFPNNRLVEHHGNKCAIEYGCANARNYFLNRWEAPIAVAGACNANCLGCISFQPKESIPSPQNRLNFLPNLDEIVGMAVPHLETAEKAIVSFGQGCEGEPLLHGELIAEAIRAIRKRTAKGILHINTNGSRPETVEKLFKAGMDSIRVSLNSTQHDLYERYYKPNNYSLDHIIESLMTARRLKKFSSINYLVFPGITDSHREVASLSNVIERTQLNLIQWRNLNIDPEWYLDEVCHDYYDDAMGLLSMMTKLRSDFPHLLFGYHNRDRDAIQEAVL